MIRLLNYIHEFKKIKVSENEKLFQIMGVLC